MTGELEFLADGKDADLNTALALDLRIPRDYEGGFGKVGLAGDRLHLFGCEAAGITENSQCISLEGLLGEYIDDREVVSL